MLAETLDICRRDTMKCERAPVAPFTTNIKFLNALLVKKGISAKEQEQIKRLYDNLTRNGLQVLSELQFKKAKTCSESAVCTLFGWEDTYFSKWVVDIQRSNITKITPIGGVTLNGFIRQLSITNQMTIGSQNITFDGHVVLKSNMVRESDSLYYEWEVGNYLNGFMDRFSIFCKTYGIYEYASGDKQLMQDYPKKTTPEEALSVVRRLKTLDNAMIKSLGRQDKEMMRRNPAYVEARFPTVENVMATSLTQPENICIVIQDIHKPIPLLDIMNDYLLRDETSKDVSYFEPEGVIRLANLFERDPSEIEKLLEKLKQKSPEARAKEQSDLRYEILCVMYQIYFVLGLMPDFSHNDLHAANVLLTPAGENKFFRFRFDGKIVDCMFKATLIDFGRSVFNGTPAFYEWLTRTTTRKFGIDDPDEIIEKQREYGFPRYYVGIDPCKSLDFRLINLCIDWGVIDESFYGSLRTVDIQESYKDSPCNIFTIAEFKKNSRASWARHRKFVRENIYPDFTHIAPRLFELIQPHTYSGRWVCEIFVSSTENIRVVWPTAGGKKTRKRAHVQKSTSFFRKTSRDKSDLSMFFK